jgi:hypothetical protein
MKKLLKTLALCAAIVVLGGLALNHYDAHNNQPFEASHSSTAQAKSSHRLSFINTEGENQDYCTGTAIGPHAILTALHCDENAQYLQVRIDYSFYRYTIQTGVVDGRDHLILLLDGPAFTNIDSYVTRAPKQGEPVYIYGNGHAQFPAPLKVGFVTNEYDPSDVNAATQLFYVSLPIIPGDSGAAIYGADGAILGIVTYRISDEAESFGFSKTEAAGFQLNYDKDTIANVQKFVPPPKEGDSDVKPDKHTAIQPKHSAGSTDGALQSPKLAPKA